MSIIQISIGETKWIAKWLTGNIICLYWFSGFDFMDVQTIKCGTIREMSLLSTPNDEGWHFLDKKSKTNRRKGTMFGIIIFILFYTINYRKCIMTL